MALSKTKMAVIVTTAPKRGPKDRAINRARVDDRGFWHGSGTFAQVVAWRKIDPWMGDVKRDKEDDNVHTKPKRDGFVEG